ncbi:MAG: hypothetical protein R2701_11705 [Acidimicrobiales bacterium]
MGKLRPTTTFRIIGLAMLAYGAATLIMLHTSWRSWALDHSVAEVVSWSDRRASNEIRGSVDEPIVIAGSAVLVFAGLWFGLLIPWVFNRQDRQARSMYDDPEDVESIDPGPHDGS